MTKRSWNRRLVVVTASAVLAGGSLALPMTAMAAPVALQHGPVALDDDPDGGNERGTSNDGGFGVQFPVDAPTGDTQVQSDTRHGENPDGVNEWGGGHRGSDDNRGSDSGARHMEDLDGVNEWSGGHRGSDDTRDYDRGSDSGARYTEDPDGVNEGGTPNDGGFGTQLPVDPPTGDTQVQTRIEAPF
ncbi:hypothetical protein [Streptomyces sp. NPDC058142]|uniref:hypothetical protein n=1 Tax=Streptomyces sp. NPDC058142 TaxID=3346355 RepID=UPI0036EEA6B6